MMKNKKLSEFFKKNSNVNTEFVRYFYGINVSDKDVKDLKNFSKVINYRNEGLPLSQIIRLLKISKRKIEHWIYDGNLPFIIRLLQHYIELGKPQEDMKWLSINSTRGGLFTGPWIQVPDEISNYEDISNVINQLNNLADFDKKNESFGYNLDNKGILFAYLLGMLIGDSSKTGIKRKQRTTRRIHVRLTKKYESNKKLGKFTSLCVNSLGLRMNRRKDCPAGKRNVYPFYTWVSQSSLLVQWVFDACLGLKDNEKTTYDPIKADWILETPREFKIWFLQGLADSDGFVDFSSHQVGIITEPNTELIEKILNLLDVKATRKFFTQSKLWCLIININDAYNLPAFNSYVRSYRYKEMEKLFKAKRISGHWPSWLKKKVENHIRNGFRGTVLARKILNEEGVAIRTKNIRRIVKELEV